jgi:methionine synthase II (cobalamin-independent)
MTHVSLSVRLRFGAMALAFVVSVLGMTEPAVAQAPKMPGQLDPRRGRRLDRDYTPLLPVFEQLTVGTLLLELCTPRAGGLAVLKALPASVRVGVGIVNQKLEQIEPVTGIVERAQRAIDLVGPERVLLTPDCGFATFADNPVASARVAEAKLRAIADAAAALRVHG